MFDLPEPPLIADPKPDERKWTRVPSVEDQHIAKSQQMILAAAEQTATGSAIVLGPGRCSELPVETLAKRYDSIDLVEMDKAALDEGLAGLSLNDALTSKLNIHRRDLTGVMDVFEAGLKKITGDETDFDAALVRMTELLESIEPKYPAIKQEYDLVVASVVLSQLHVAVSNLALTRVAEQWPDHVQTLRASRPWTQAMLKLAQALEPAFVRYVQALLAAGGRIYLSATMHTCFLHAAQDGGWYTDGRYRMTVRNGLADYLGDGFDIEAHDSWFWIAKQPVATKQVGRLFVVEAIAIKKT